LEKCFSDEPVLIVDTKLTETKGVSYEAEDRAVGKLLDESQERDKSKNGIGSDCSVTHKDGNESMNEMEVKEEQCRSLYISFSHLINLANNLGCVQRSTSAPENKVFTFYTQICFLLRLVEHLFYYI
jgi:hypothetical protein